MTGFPFPKHEDTLVNLTCSILKRFSVEPPHPSLALADKLLSGGCRRVVLLVLDGMGSRILRQHLAEDGFFRSHLAGDIASTFPPTTVAATTSLQSGLFPVETGWLGWDCHFPALDRTVVYFRNADRQGNPLPDGKTASRELVAHGGGVGIIAVSEDGDVLMVSQYRIAAREMMLEIPAGKLEKGEDPLECGKRELIEETGYEAEEFTHLGTYYATPGYCEEKLHIYLARGLNFVGQNLDEGEFLNVKKYKLDDKRTSGNQRR